MSALEERLTKVNSAWRLALLNLEKSYDYTLELLGDALDLRASSNEGHSRRVTGYTVAIARAIGLRKEDIAVIARGAFLHSVARFGVPDSILEKGPPLTADEMAIMREQCVRGYRMLRRIPFLQAAAEVVYAQYECYDGTGYPRGLKGKEIPLGARIFHVANALDVLTADTPFDGYHSLDGPRDKIDELSGTQFDPEVVSVFLHMPRKIWIDLRREIDRSTT